QVWIRRRNAGDFTFNPAETRSYLIFAPAVCHQLHANADTEERLALFANTLLERLDHARNFIEAATTICKRTDSRQHNAVSTRHHIGIAGDCDRLFLPAVARGAFESLSSRMQIAEAIVDDGNVHLSAPGSGNKPITSDGEGGPRRIGVEYLGSSGAAAAGGEMRVFAHSVKKRCSAISASSPTTKPSVTQPRRVSVQRQLLGASKPINKAIRNPARNCSMADAPSSASPIPINP